MRVLPASPANKAWAKRSYRGLLSAGIFGLRLTLEYSSLYGLRRLGLEYMAIREEILWVAHFANTFWSNSRGNCIVSRHDGLNKRAPRKILLAKSPRI